MTELDKFKRRLIRSVARRLLLHNDPEEQVWQELRKETGCDCQLLWKRMRALTIKKLKRLLAAGDKVDNVAAVARLSVNDWLLFDLVLVHEKIDLIDKTNIAKHKRESAVLQELFELVREYKIELKAGDQLVEAWMSLTREYNGRGRQVSAMLLQRRWYQLKELTRSTFYQLWFSYRGNNKLWDAARTQAEPTQLQADIARDFPYLITKEFPEWEDLIQQKKVILSFEDYEMRKKETAATQNDGKPDIEMIEPVIETIDLGAESDGDTQNPISPSEDSTIRQGQELIKKQSYSSSAFEESNLETDNATDFDLAAVKQEPLEEVDGLTNVMILQTSHVPEGEDMPSTSNDAKKHRSQQLNMELEEINQELKEINEYVDTDNNEIDEFAEIQELPENIEMSGNEDSNNETESPGTSEKELIPDDLIKQKADEFIKNKIMRSEILKFDTTKVIDVTDESFDDIIKKKADDFVRKVDLKKLANEVVEELSIPKKVDPEANVDKIEKESVDKVSAASETLDDDGIEFVDDGIEEEEDDIICIDYKQAPAGQDLPLQIKSEEDNQASHNIAKETTNASIDLKLLMNPIVYTVKLDEMETFKDKPFDSVTDVDAITKARKESLPVKKHIKADIRMEEVKVEYETPLQNSDLLNETASNLQNAEDSNDIEKDSGESDAASETNSEIDEHLKVKASDCLLQKPKYRTYNPIQVCKNPDFNTRLKRLTAGFFCYSRNKQLLNACKPLTIDLNKAFESKLVNGTLYLKSSGGSPQKPVERDNVVQAPSVVPSAMPVQSLLNQANCKVDINDLVPASADTFDSNLANDDDDVAERNKVINLRDLSEIRRINQKLLTAQVPPIRVERERSSNLEQLHSALLQDIGEMQPQSEKHENAIAPPKKRGPKSRTSLVDELSGAKDYLPIALTERFSTKGRKYPPKPTYAQMPLRQISVPWRPKPLPMNLDDSYITIDTLNRMINKLNGRDEKLPITKKEEKKNLEKPAEKPGVFAPEGPKVVAPPLPPHTKPPPPPHTKPPPPPRPKQPRPLKGPPRRMFCCWASQKLHKLVRRQTTSRIHECEIICTCCCRAELLRELEKHPMAKSSLLSAFDPIVRHWQASKSRAQKDTIVLSDDEADSPKPKIRVFSSDNEPKPDPVTTPSSSPEELKPLFRVNISFSPAPTMTPILVPAAPSSDETAAAASLLLADPPLVVRRVPSPQISGPSIIIDGSQNPRPNRTVFVNKKVLLDKPKECPIYLGKDKILLTTVKFPPYIAEAGYKRKEPYKPKIVPNLDLPVGVQLLLLANGQLTCVIDPTVKLTPEQMKTLPQILAAAQKQLDEQGLSAASVSEKVTENNILPAVQPESLPSQETPTVTDVVEDVGNVPDDETQGLTAAINTKNLNSSNDSEIISIEEAEGTDPATDAIQNSEEPRPDKLQNTHSEEPRPNELQATNSEESISNELQNTSETQNIAAATVENNDAAGGSRNLLSDLMEMSGISAEDTTAPVQDIISQVEPATDEPALELPQQGVASNTVETTELSPITSLTQLKYACAQNGKFFKLDLTTGVIMPIEVCIRKNQRKHNVPPTVKSVIDLTDDGERNAEEAQSSSQGADDRALSKDGTIKPVKLFKVRTEEAPKRPIVLQRQKRSNLLDAEKEVTIKSVVKRSRKQRFGITLSRSLLKSKVNKVEAKIDLVDSDAPMEEEYLVETSDSEDSVANIQKGGKATNSEITTKTVDSDDDSSDDEPLAKKFVRMRAHDSNKQEVCGTIVDKTTSNEDNEAVAPAEERPQESMEVETADSGDINASHMVMEESPMLQFLVDESEAQDDCILGF